MLKKINGFDPMAFQGVWKNEIAGTGARVPMDSYSLAREGFFELRVARYPKMASAGTYAWYVDRFRKVAEYEKLRDKVDRGEAGPEVFPEREEGVEDLSQLTLNGEITSRTEQLRDILRTAEDDVRTFLQGFDVDLPGYYDSKEFWIGAAAAVEAKAGEETIPDFSEDLLDDEMGALLKVGREEAEVDLEELAEIAVLYRFANLVTDKI